MPLIKSCAKLLEKVLSTGKRAVVLCGTSDRVADLNAGLWTYATQSFLPHGTVREGNAARQPVWITTEVENPNGAEIVIIVDGQTITPEDSFHRCLDIFDGMDQTAVEDARRRWQLYRERGDTLAYWKQNSSGLWEQPQNT
tara:strand:- start:1800 stop:2222 length:423 start_codon:yes stop_codon:yes gene_type:complete